MSKDTAKRHRKKHGESAALTTPDFLAEQKEQLRQLLPQVFTEGKIDVDKLRAAVGDTAAAINPEPQPTRKTQESLAPPTAGGAIENVLGPAEATERTVLDIIRQARKINFLVRDNLGVRLFEQSSGVASLG